MTTWQDRQGQERRNPTATALREQKRARAVAMAAADPDLPTLSIAERVGASRGAVADWLREAGLTRGARA
jgi:hypothetical protein